MDISEIYQAPRKQLEKEIIYLMKKRESLEKAISENQRIVAGLTNEVQMLEARNKQWVIRAEAQDRIVNQQIENVNKQNNIYLEEIERLRAEVRRLKNDRDNQLGNESDISSKGGSDSDTVNADGDKGA
ncbi:MAG: hypothetical protein DRP09_12160 [Candidatus Thorarchaeota archaeon]|nr:MAG: hypothetical protein DRP09_12160 [Candidatus Thorarchaeota archaeon]